MVSVVASLARRKVTPPSKGKDVRRYPFRDPPATLRTSDSVLENALSAVENNTRVKGFYDVTPLAKLPRFLTLCLE